MTQPNPFAADLLAWYDRLGVQLPWRGDPDPYHVWLSEIMLQQTQIETVKPYYARFLAAYPTVQTLAAAPLDDVLKLWEGLGYYSRARNLHRCAQMVVAEHGGQFPRTAAELLALPGIGRYTAGAISSIAFGERAPVLDGNVIRVFARLLDLPDDVTLPGIQAALWRQAKTWLPENTSPPSAERNAVAASARRGGAKVSEHRVGDYNQALMDLGRLVCRPKAPLCSECPIREHCRAFANGTQAVRPVKGAKKATPHYHVAAGIIWNERGELLIGQRPADGLLGGLWEFPGGKQEAGETLESCLARELGEELAIRVEVGELYTVVKHGFTHFSITLHAFQCQYAGAEAADGKPQAIGVQAWAWVHPDDLDRYAFGKADRAIIAELKARRGMLF